MTKTMRGALIRLTSLAIVALAMLGVAPPASGVSLQEMTRLDGYAETELWGYGLVFGLPGTGDKAGNTERDQILAKLGESAGSPVADLRALTNAKNVALVMVTARVPKEGARAGDVLDCYVQARYDASSLKGGRLFITPLQGPSRAGLGVYASASGQIVVENELTPTSGMVRMGARITYDIEKQVIGPEGTLVLNIEPQYASWPTARLIANSINQDRAGLSEEAMTIARAIDAKTVLVQIPDPELANPANFIGDIMSIRLEPSLLNLPARVVINESRGTIIVTGNAQISGVAIAHKDLIVTELNPSRPPTLENPEVRRSRWTTTGTAEDERSNAMLQDLLRALRQLDVPVQDQIDILAKMHAQGMLHAQFIRE